MLNVRKKRDWLKKFTRRARQKGERDRNKIKIRLKDFNSSFKK